MFPSGQLGWQPDSIKLNFIESSDTEISNLNELNEFNDHDENHDLANIHEQDNIFIHTETTDDQKDISSNKTKSII